jgi:hypothetical protein
MVRGRLFAILAVVIGGLFLVGCECNRQQWPGLYDNLSGADWRAAMKDCGAYCADARDPSNNSDLSSLNSNFSGDDWVEYVAGSCCRPAGCVPPAPGQ